MKLFLMSDLEGVAGVLSGREYLYPGGRYYDTARRLLTDEVNAAIDGFAAGGFDTFLVCDGHGAGELGVPVIFAAGEEALCREAEALAPWIITAAVLRGVVEATGDELSMEEYELFHEAAVHLQPRRANAMIRDASEQAARKFAADRASFPPLESVKPPYHLRRVYRHTKTAPGRVVEVHGDSIIDLLNRKNG